MYSNISDKDYLRIVQYMYFGKKSLLSKIMLLM